MRTKVALVAVSLILGLANINVFAGEHPSEHPSSSEHPTKKSKKHEHPSKHKEHPKQSKGSSSISMKDFAKAVKRYVKEDSALKGGYFLVYDSEDKSTLELKLDKVHTERLAKVDDGVYFACADFKASNGKIYDLDVFMKGHNADTLQVTEVTVHKKDGKARYGWKEKNGIWIKVASK